MKKPFYSTIDVVSQLPSEYILRSVNYHDDLLNVAHDYVEVFLRNHHCTHAHNETCKNCSDIVDLINKAEGKIKGGLAEA